jgi:hypothetical protein
MAEINMDIGHALSREDQRRNRRQPCFYLAVVFLLFFLRKSRGEVPKKISVCTKNTEETDFFAVRFGSACASSRLLEISVSISDAETLRTPKALHAKDGTRCPPARRSIRRRLNAFSAWQGARLVQLSTNQLSLSPINETGECTAGSAHVGFVVVAKNPRSRRNVLSSQISAAVDWRDDQVSDQRICSANVCRNSVTGHASG